MDSHIRKVYVPMTETGFYILLCLREEAHGYSIVKNTEKLNRKLYRITELGTQVLDLEMRRIERLYQNMLEAR